MRKLLISALILTGLVSIALADVTVSGDARVRPRMDVKDYGEYGDSNGNTSYTDNYYMYRARLFVKADIGDGWYFKTTLGTNGLAYWTGKFGTGDKPHSGSLASSGRGAVSFMELYYGLKRANYGFQMGILPLSGYSNPSLDLHFYPTKVVDIPWLIWNNNALHGFSGYYKAGPGTLKAWVSVDNNPKQSVEPLEGDATEAKDQYTLMFNYGLSFAGVKVDPWFLYTLADEGAAAPMTYGANVTGPKVAGFTPAASFFMTSQSVDETATYSGNLLRFKVSGKVGPGSLLFWYDMAKMEWDDAATHDYSYIWAHYKYVVYKSDKGEFSLKPTFRLATDAVADTKDYSRSKIELTTEFKFK